MVAAAHATSLGRLLVFAAAAACRQLPPLGASCPVAVFCAPLQVWATAPGLLLAFGIVLLAVGAALVATPLTIARARRGGGSAPRPPPQAQPASVNAEGVPIGAALVDQEQQGELADCTSQLRNHTAYSAAAVAAEERLLGVGAAALPRPELQRTTDGLPPLLFGTVFWVLVSQSHPWTPEFQTAAATQVRPVGPAVVVQPCCRLASRTA